MSDVKIIIEPETSAMSTDHNYFSYHMNKMLSLSIVVLLLSFVKSVCTNDLDYNEPSKDDDVMFQGKFKREKRGSNIPTFEPFSKNSSKVEIWYNVTE